MCNVFFKCSLHAKLFVKCPRLQRVEAAYREIVFTSCSVQGNCDYREHAHQSPSRDVDLVDFAIHHQLMPFNFLCNLRPYM